MLERNIKKFKNQLLKNRERILLQLDFDRQQIQDFYKKDIGDMVDHAFTEYEKARTLQMAEQGKISLVAIDEALVRFEKGAYGQCQVCGEPLRLKRLHALPWANTCVNPSLCKNKRKQKTKTKTLR